MGEPAKMLVLEAILKTVKQENLVENTKKTGDVLLKGLKDLGKQNSQLIMNVRGRGTFCAFDMPTAATRDKYVSHMRNAGRLTFDWGVCFTRLSSSRYSNGILRRYSRSLSSGFDFC